MNQQLNQIMTQPQFAIAVQFHIAPEHVEAFKRRVVQQATDSLAKEVGCLQFDVLIDQSNPNTIFLYETYLDAAAFETHRATEHFADFTATITPWVVSKSVMRLGMIHSSAVKS